MGFALWCKNVLCPESDSLSDGTNRFPRNPFLRFLSLIFTQNWRPTMRKSHKNPVQNRKSKFSINPLEMGFAQWCKNVFGVESDSLSNGTIRFPRNPFLRFLSLIFSQNWRPNTRKSHKKSGRKSKINFFI